MNKKGINLKMFLNILPESTPNMIIIPMNQHGDGYIVSSYDPRYLTGLMTSGEFRYIATEITRITAVAYSENRIVDIGQVPRKLVWMSVFAYILSAIALILLQMSINGK